MILCLLKRPNWPPSALANPAVIPAKAGIQASYNISMKPLVIFMAGSTAAGKTQMAHYLSEEFSLPIFSTDSIRYDTKVDKDEININEIVEDFHAARKTRGDAMFERGKSFICDGSVDRDWDDRKKAAEEAGFDWLLIDFDLSRERIMKNRKLFDRIENDELFDRWIAEHQKFHETSDQDAQLHITDDNYGHRYQLAEKLVKKALK